MTSFRYFTECIPCNRRRQPRWRWRSQWPGGGKSVSANSSWCWSTGQRERLTLKFRSLSKLMTKTTGAKYIKPCRAPHYRANLMTLWQGHYPSILKSNAHNPSTRNYIVSQQEVKVIWQKAPHGGPIPRLGVTPGGRNLYHWIPGVGVPISVP